MYSFPNLQGNVKIRPLSLDVVSIESFGITSLENMAFAAQFTIVHALPILPDIIQSLFAG